MSDPRIILKEELISIGIAANQAAIIALDAGSSQAFVNKEYLDEFKFHKSISNKALAIITKFYNGELSID
jgi:hypothetical protein